MRHPAPGPNSDGTGRRGGIAADRRHVGLRQLLRHYLEMVLAMWVGMAVLGPMVRGALAAAGLGYSRGRYPELAALEMTITMAVGMGAWMRYRRHGWASTLEMGGAMLVPAIVLVPLLWLDAIPARSLSTLLHLVMLALMLVVLLWRRSQDTS
jgi:hypothetical protein